MDQEQWLANYGPAAVITGASSGIGEAFARLLAAKGMDLVLVARRAERLNKLAADLCAKHTVKVQTCVADLADEKAIAQIQASCENLDVGLLISNAGFGMKGPHENNDPATMTRMLAVNCHAPMQLTHSFIPRLKQRSRSGIIITSSVESLLGFAYSAPYAASKAFATSLAEGLWAELKPGGIDVLGLCPSSTDTETLDMQGIDKSTLVGMMQPEEVAAEALANIDQGPTLIPGEHNREMFAGVTAMPRSEAIAMMAETMKAALS